MKVLGNKLFSMLILGLLVLSYFYELPNEFAHKVALASVEEPGAFLTGVIFDQGVNDDNDTKFEWLEIGIQINVTECDQQYGVKYKELFSSDSNVIFVDTDVVTEPFELGLQTQYIYIPSPWIFCSGLNPIALYNVELISYSDERGVNTIGLLEQIPLSREYSYTEFTPPGAKLTGVIFEQGLDYNEDGTFDFLQIGVQVNVTKEADYCISVSGGMYSGQVHFLGLQLANITISGKMISVSNQNIRSIDYIILNDYSGYRIQRIDDVPLSREYFYTEFDKPGALLTGNIHDRGVDEDDDSTFDYLEIVAEVNVTYTGNYYVGASRLVVNKTHSIPIGGGQYLNYVDSGMYNVSVKIDGSAVYSSQMNPINVSIEVWGEMMDYHQNIMDVSLSRRYNYKEFDQPQFNEGDWGKYKVSATWHSSNPETTEPTSITETNKITSMIIEVQDVFGQTITLSKTSTYQDGASEQIQANSYEMYTIPSNLKTNDTIPGSYIAFSPAVETRGIYAGMERDLIYGKINTSFFGMNMSMDAFWDRSTGILCQMNTTIESSFGEETTRQSTLTEIVDTNLWERVISARASLDLYENYGFWTEDDFIEAGT